MLKYKKLLNQKEQYLKKYCSQLRKNKKHNIEINKLNELILSKIKYLKLTNKYYYPNNIYEYFFEYYKKCNYQIKYEDIVKCLNEYKKVYKYQFSYWELEEIKAITYYILIDSICSLIMDETRIIRYSTRKEKTVYNILTSINIISDLDTNSLINDISDTEKLLLETTEYQELSLNSKFKYRKKIIEKSTINKISEYQYVENLIKQKHTIASMLFRRINYYKINIIVIITSILCSILLFLLGYICNTNIIMNIPLSLINYYILYKIFSWLVPKEDILECSKENIPNTMCVKYTILNNDKDVLKILNELEQTYLNYNNPNLHFTLIVDCTDCDHQIEPFDDEILDVGINKTLELNEKYNQDIFYFVYRKRVKTANIWHGYNRKNGAIEQFIKLLLNEISDDEDYQCFMGHSDFYTNYKYLVLLDNAIDVIRLVNILEHPFNKPIHIKDKLVYGYASFSDKGKISYGESNTYSNYIIRIDEYHKLLENRMPNNLLCSNLLKGSSITNKKEKKLYSKETVLKNNIHLFNWILDKNSPVTKIQKIKYIHNMLEIFISIISFILLFYAYISNMSFIWVIYLGIINFIFLIPWHINIKVLFKYLFNKIYRLNCLELRKDNYLLDFVLIGIIILFGLYLNINIISEVVLIVIILIELIRRHICDR